MVVSDYSFVVGFSKEIKTLLFKLHKQGDGVTKLFNKSGIWAVLLFLMWLCFVCVMIYHAVRFLNRSLFALIYGIWFLTTKPSV